MTAALVGALLLFAHDGIAGAGAPPKVVQISYAESDDGSSPAKRLYAFVRRADAVRFATRYEGKRATAGSRYRPSITDTDLHGKEVRHPWSLVRKNGGRRVLRLVAKALDERGVATIRVRARGAGGVDKVRVRMKLAQCSQDPPLYPVDCEVRP